MNNSHQLREQIDQQFNRIFNLLISTKKLKVEGSSKDELIEVFESSNLIGKRDDWLLKLLFHFWDIGEIPEETYKVFVRGSYEIDLTKPESMKLSIEKLKTITF